MRICVIRGKVDGGELQRIARIDTDLSGPFVRICVIRGKVDGENLPRIARIDIEASALECVFATLLALGAFDQATGHILV